MNVSYSNFMIDVCNILIRLFCSRLSFTSLFNSQSYRFTSKSLEPIAKMIYISILEIILDNLNQPDRFVIGK